MIQQRVSWLPRVSALLAMVSILLIYFPILYAGNTDKNPLATENASLNLRDVYLGTINDQQSALVGKVGIALVEPTGIKQVPIEYAFKSGDKFRFFVSSNHDGFLYILHRSLDNNLKQLWPHATTSDAFEIRSRQTYSVPPSPGVFIFDEAVGKEQFYIAVRSEPKAPRQGVFAEVDKANQMMSASDASDKSSTQQVEWTIGSDPFGERATRGVVFDPGTADGDLYRYFSAAPGDHSTKAMLQIMLKHRK